MPRILIDISRGSSVQMNKESRDVQLLMPITSGSSPFLRNSIGLERYRQVKDQSTDELRSVFLHLRSEVPGTKSVQIEPQSKISAEEMGPSQFVQQIKADAPVAVRGADIASGNCVRYRECRKNHAASIGGYVVDGCAEFMGSGEEGTAAAMTCAACNCHRNFHRREAENERLCECHRIRR